LRPFGVKEYCSLLPEDRPLLKLDIDDAVQNLIDRQSNKNAKIRLEIDQPALRRIIGMHEDEPVPWTRKRC